MSDIKNREMKTVAVERSAVAPDNPASSHWISTLNKAMGSVRDTNHRVCTAKMLSEVKWFGDKLCSVSG